MSSGQTSTSAATASGPPYMLTTAGLGGAPVPKVDDPICAVLLLFFIAGAATNMTILQVNRRRGHKFLMSGMTFGFCMARITALVMRIVWASRPTNIRIAIAAQVFTFAGVVLLFLINLIFTQRLVRAYRPRIGWSKPVTIFFRFFFISVLGCLVMVIPVTVDMFYTLNAHIHFIDHRVQLVGTTWMAMLAFLPIPLTLLTLFARPLPPHHGTVETFGQGQMRTKVFLLLFTSCILSLGAAFRAATSYKVRPQSDPAWYDSKPCYYCFNFVIEIIVVYTYTLSRFDKRFHVPNGSSGPGHYAAGGAIANKGGADDTENAGGDDSNGLERKTTLADRINTEGDVFFGSDTDRADKPNSSSSQADAWDAKARDELRKEEEGSAA